jgi:hypothetical protein
MCAASQFIHLEYDKVNECLQFVNYPLYDMPELTNSEDEIREVCSAIQRGVVKQIRWIHGRGMTKFLVPIKADETIEYFLSFDGVLSFPNLVRLARVRPIVVIRLICHVAGLDGKVDQILQSEISGSPAVRCKSLAAGALSSSGPALY